jgi:opacity protein-like surface antigen
MMTKLALAAAAAAAALAATPALAQSASGGPWYAGAGYTHYDFDGVEVGGVTGRLGYRFHPNFAVEGEGTIGTTDDDAAELDNAYGVYGVGVVPVSERLDLFGRVGYQQVSIAPAIGPDVEEDGVGFGAGANFRVSDRFGIRGEYTRLDNEDAEADTFSVGGVVNF